MKSANFEGLSALLPHFQIEDSLYAVPFLSTHG